jgi:hypothetical protein
MRFSVTASAPVRSTDDTHGELLRALPRERGTVSVTASVPVRSTDDTHGELLRALPSERGN